MQGGKNWILRKRLMQTGSSETLIGGKSEPVFVDLVRRPGIDSLPGGSVQNPICRTGPPGYMAGEIDSSVSIPGLHKRLQIRALVTPLMSLYGTEWRERGNGLS
jgi:hypothetical protein